MGGYFFLLLQTLMTRLITLTMRIQNWNSSEYVIIIAALLSKCRRALKKLSPSANAVESRPLAVYR